MMNRKNMKIAKSGGENIFRTAKITNYTSFYIQYE